MRMPVCPGDQAFMRVQKNGVDVVEMASFGPYRIWSGDLWRCPVCGCEIVVFTDQAEAHYHHQENFARRLEMAQVKIYPT